MQVKEKTAAQRFAEFFVEEREKTLARYRILNELSVKGKTLFTGSSLMEQFPVNEMLMSRGESITVYNRGIGGLKSDDMLKYMEEMVFGTEPSKIVINIGTNDIGGAEYTLEHLIDNYQKIIDQIRGRLGDIPVYMMAYYPVNASPEIISGAPAWVQRTFKNRTNENINLANREVQRLAEEKGCIYIDVNEGLKDEKGNLKKEFTIEGIHMYPNAYQIILNNLMPYLKDKIEKF